MPINECVAIAAFTLIPVFTQVLAKTVTNAFTKRHALPAIIGISLITAILVDWRVRGRVAGWCRPSCSSAGSPSCRCCLSSGSGGRDAYSLLRRELEHEPTTRLPILVADARDYLQLNYQAPEPLAGRLVFASGAAADRAEISSASEVERLGHWVDLKIHDLAGPASGPPRGSSSLARRPRGWP